MRDRGHDIVYNSVRFRHREIREMLSTEWANELPAGGAVWTFILTCTDKWRTLNL